MLNSAVCLCVNFCAPDPTIFPLLWEKTKKKINFLVWDMILLPFIVDIKEVVVGGVTSGILYNVSSKEIITAWALDSYTTCHFHKYDFSNNTSQTSRGATSHNTSSVKGLCCRDGGTAGGLRDLALGEATRCCTTTGVVWSVGPTASRHLLKWGSFGFVDNELQWWPLHPHLWVEKMLPLL